MSVSTDRHQSSLARQQHDYFWDNVNNLEVQKADLAYYKGREEVGCTSSPGSFKLFHLNRLFAAVF